MATTTNQSPPPYTTGTVAGVVGQALVTGAGTAWMVTDANGNTVAAVFPGDLLIVPTGSYPIKSVDSATQITLELPLVAMIPMGTPCRIKRYIPSPSASVLGSLQQVLGIGTDVAPDLSRTIDSGAGRAKFRINSAGQAEIAVGPTGTADSALVPALQISQSGAFSFPAGIVQVNDVNYAASVNDRIIIYSGLSATRTVTLPAASAFPTGALLTVLSQTNTLNGIVQISIVPSVGDTINGLYIKSIFDSFGLASFKSDGVSNWIIENQSGFSVLHVNGVSGINPYSISQRSTSNAWPISYVRPQTNGQCIGFDLIPSGSPSPVATNGYTWMDCCSGDAAANSAIPFSTARVGIQASFAEFGSRSYNTGALLPIAFTFFDGLSLSVAAMIDPSGNVGLGEVPSAASAKLSISRNPSPMHAGPSGIVLQIDNADTVPTRVMIDGYAAQGTVNFRRANTGSTAPSALQTGDIIGLVSWYGYGATGYSSTGRATISAMAAAPWSDTDQSTYISVQTTPVGSVTSVERARFDNVGNLQMGGTIAIDAGGLHNVRSYTVATLPAPGVLGRLAYASNGRMYNGVGNLEAAGAGTGGLVTDFGTNWRIAGLNQGIQA